MSQVWKRCTYLTRACTSVLQLKCLHATFIVHGLPINSYAMANLVSSFTRLGDLSYASIMLDRIELPSPFVYNSLIAAYSKSSQPESVLRCFNQMLMANNDNVKPDCFTLSFAILACGFAFRLVLGQQLHGWVCKNGAFVLDSHVPTSVVRLYIRCGKMADARKAFDEILKPDLVQWNVIFDGYVKMGFESEALQLFQDMLAIGVEPDEFCVTTALKACAQSGAILQGKWLHEYVKKRECLKVDLFVSTSLVDMYAKCGCLSLAEDVFGKMPKRNLFSWAAMIGGYATHGYATEAIRCLDEMLAIDGLRPDSVVLLGVLTACTHAGMLEEGHALLDTMHKRFGVAPKIEHYSCVVDLLCRAGSLNDAIELINGMPMKPLASVWGAFLSGCRTHKNIELAELAFGELLKLVNGNQAEEEAAFVQLSNVYLSLGRIKDANRIRRTIGEKGLKKMVVGSSMIELGGMVYEFVAGDAFHKHIDDIRSALTLIALCHQRIDFSEGFDYH